MEIVVWIITGGLIGLVYSVFSRKKSNYSLLTGLVVGAVGAVVCQLLLRFLGVNVSSEPSLIYWKKVLVSAAGAVVLVVTYNLIGGGKK